MKDMERSAALLSQGIAKIILVRLGSDREFQYQGITPENGGCWYSSEKAIYTTAFWPNSNTIPRS